jgi:hypothetical protein
MRYEKLVKVTKEHAEAMYAIALDKLQRDREKRIKKQGKR